MRAVKFDEFGGPLSVAMVEDPTPSADAAIIEVRASGICRSDWHGWQGHDPDIVSFPHVPGHELVAVRPAGPPPVLAPRRGSACREFWKVRVDESWWSF